MLKENGYQGSIISKIFRRITNNHNFPQSQQLMQATNIQEEEINMSINLLHVEGTSEKGINVPFLTLLLPSKSWHSFII